MPGESYPSEETFDEWQMDTLSWQLANVALDEGLAAYGLGDEKTAKAAALVALDLQSPMLRRLLTSMGFSLPEGG